MKPGLLVLLLILFSMPVGLARAEVPSSTAQGLELPPILMPQDYMSGPTYQNLVRQAIAQRPKEFEFGLLRNLYPRTEQYDPIGEMTRKRMVTLAYTIENDPDSENRKKAFDEYGELVAAHLGNIDVISQALVLARGDKMYGDPSFFEWMQKGLLRDIYYSGDGTKLTRAYDVVTLGEETMLLKALKLRVLKTESAEEGGTFYNMHEVQNPAYPDKNYWIFVNVSVPMAYLRQKEYEDRKSFSIPPQ